jgi:hypothetical protein
MKTTHIISALLFFLLLGFSSCREITVTTKINPDGSFTRMIKVTGDSAEVNSRDLPFPVDETWKKSFSMDSTDTTRYLVTYSKSFRNSDILNESIKNDTSSYGILKRQISVNKKNGFFFSYLTFKEVYKCVNPFQTIDYKKFVSEEDIRITDGTVIPLTPADSAREKDAEDNIDQYLLKSVVAELESITQEGIGKLGDNALSGVKLSDYHDSICAGINRLDLKKGDEVLDLYANYSGNDAFLKLKTLQPPLYQGFDEKLSILYKVLELSGYKEVVELPGLITGTNSATINGNQVSWDFAFLPVLVRDLEFNAESRVINYWAFFLSGFVVFFLVALLVVKSIKK